MNLTLELSHWRIKGASLGGFKVLSKCSRVEMEWEDKPMGID